MKSAEEILNEVFADETAQFLHSLIGVRDAKFITPIILKAMEAYAAQQKSEWVPVGERLPDESDGDVIMIFDSKDNLPYTTMYKKPEEWEEYGRVKITHWARITLPSPPKK